MPRKTRLFYRGMKSIGIVDVGANEGADILVAKRKMDAPAITAKQRADTAKMLADLVPEIAAKIEGAAVTFSEMIRNDEARQEANQMVYRFQDSLCSILTDSTVDQSAMLQQSLAEFTGAFMAKISAWASTYTTAKVGAKVSGANMSKIKAAMTALQEIITQVEGEMTTDKNKKIDPAPEPEKQQDPPTPDPAPELSADDSLKGLPVAVQKRIRDAEESAKADRLVAAEAQKIAKEERDIRLTGEMVAKVRAELPRITAKPEEFGAVMKRAKDVLAEADFNELNRVLKAASEQLAAGGIMQPVGSSGEGSTAASAWDEIEAQAKAAVVADGALTIAKARDLVMKRNPELVKKYRAEKQAAH